MNTRKLILLPFAALALVSCDAQNAQSPRVPVGMVDRDLQGQRVETQAAYFAPKDVTFKYTQLFMWKKDLDPSDVVKVLDTTKTLEDAQDQVFLLKTRGKDLRAQFTAIGVDLQQYPDDVGTTLPAKQSQLAKAQSQLAALQAEPQTDDTAKQIEVLNTRIAKLNAAIDPILKEQAAVKTAHLEAAVDEWNQLDGTLTQKEQEANDDTQPLNDLVWVFNSSPIHFSFHFTQSQGIEAAIHNWDLSEINDQALAEQGAPTEFFSTGGTTAASGAGVPSDALSGAAAISNVVYNPEGGSFTFEVETPAARYRFKIFRTKYHDIDGRIHYKGDIIRCSVNGAGKPVFKHVLDIIQCDVGGGDGSAVMRRGAANLVDQDDIS